MATAKRPRRDAGNAQAKTAGGQAMSPALPETPDMHSAPTLTMAADTPAVEQLAAASTLSVPTPAASTPAPAAKAVADGPTLIQRVSEPALAAPPSDTLRVRSSSAEARAATAQSLASERTAMMRQRALIAGGLAVLVLLGGLLAYRLLMPETSAAPAPLAQVPAEPAAQSTVAPAAPAPLAQVPAEPAAPAVQAQPTAAPAVQIQPTAAPVAQIQPAAVTCAEIAGLPVFAGATCIEYDTDQDNGLAQTKNTYRTNAAAADVGRFYEGAFGSNGWVLQKFAYSVELGARRLQVEVDVEQGATGPVTQINLTERGAPAGARSTCMAIDGLPAYPNATCSDFDTDQKNGLIEAKNTYTTSASPEEVRSFYANAFKQSGWAGQEFSYSLTQGQRQLKVELDPKTAADGAYTQIKVTAK